MIEIKFAAQNEVKEICRRLKAEYIEGLKVYVAVEAGNPLGGCGFYIDGKEGTLAFTYMNEAGLEPIEDGLLRASLSYMYENGVETAVSKGNISEKMLRRLGFKEKNDVYVLDLLHSFLTAGCSCSNN